MFSASPRVLQKAPSWISGPLTTKELLNGAIQWIRSFQHRYFAAEIEYLHDQKGRQPPSVTQLDLYLDNDSLIRCKGRLLNTDIPQAARNHVLLPKSSETSGLVISYFHERSLHSGVSDTICHIRQRFWIPSICQQVKSILSVFGRTKLKFTEFRTIVTEIEATLHDRPLTYMSSDLNDPQALSPSHLMYGDRSTPLPCNPAVEEELLTSLSVKSLLTSLTCSAEDNESLKPFDPVSKRTI